VQVPFATTELYVGLPVTSHHASSSASAVFDDVEVGSPF
jgi:hypothetical protein